MVIDPATPKRSHPFTMQLTLAGTQSIQWIPTARNAVLEATGNWPHPSFNGRFLPDKREVTDQGYRATWQLSEFSHDTPAALARCARESVHAAKQAERGHEVCSGVHHNTFGINYVQPGDLYAQLDRATKYGFLFIGLTFAAFLLTELLKRMSVHPVQYGLTGLALAMFFVLLIALSEHIAFAHAYGIASAACVALIAYYVAYALGTWKAGATFGAGLASLYVAMYWLLKSEQYALLLGAGLLFGLLAAVMVGTRKVDWYGLKTAKAAT
jgi:inner membrane protein